MPERKRHTPVRLARLQARVQIALLQEPVQADRSLRLTPKLAQTRVPKALFAMAGAREQPLWEKM